LDKHAQRNGERRLVERRELLALQQLVAELRVEALAVAILPRAARLDVERLHTDPAEPGSNALGDELWPIVRSNMLGRAVAAHEIGQTVKHVVGAKPPRDDDGEARPCELVDHGEHAELAFVFGLILHEVVAPNVIGSLRA
jgi:hypothetical protein